MTEYHFQEKPSINNRCTGCGYCYLLCPRKAITPQYMLPGKPRFRIEKNHCNLCGKCQYACPVDALFIPALPARGRFANKKNTIDDHCVNLACDVLVIGAGIGGLLCAAALSSLGRTVVVVERLNFNGGRFTHFSFEDTLINTGACHTIPYGSRGSFGRLIESLDIAVKIHDAECAGSIYYEGKLYPWKNTTTPGKPFTTKEILSLLKIAGELKTGKLKGFNHSFAEWLKQENASEKILLFLEKVVNFGCSTTLENIPFEEARSVAVNFLTQGITGVPEGGCGYLINKLVERITSREGIIINCSEAKVITSSGCRATGARVLNRKNKRHFNVQATTVISAAGPVRTLGMLEEKGTIYGDGLTCKKNRAAEGINIHFLSDISLLPDRGGVLFCLSTRRIAGIVQPTSLVPGLAPEGKHLLVSHQVIKSNNLNRELELGLQDLKLVFGKKFDRHCRVLNSGFFTGSWPVNRAAQGSDYRFKPPLDNLYFVGDGCKYPGFVMVEGIARQVEEIIKMIN